MAESGDVPLPTPSDSQDKNPEELARRLEETTFRLNQKIVQLETLHQAGLALAASLQVEEVMGESMLLAVGMVDAHGGFLFLKEETGNRLHSRGIPTCRQNRSCSSAVARCTMTSSWR